MTAIETRFIGPTNHRGPRVTAVALGTRQRLTLPWTDNQSAERNHDRAAAELIRRYGWGGPWHRGDGYQGACVYVRSLEHTQLGKD